MLCIVFQSEDSDEEDLCAISNKWTFQRASQRWSRVEDADALIHQSGKHDFQGDIKMKITTSNESVLTDLSEPEVSSIHSESSGGSDHRSQSGITNLLRETNCSGQYCAKNTSVQGPSSIGSPSSQFSEVSPNFRNEKTTRTRAKTFLKRMETLKPKGQHGKSKGSGLTSLSVIGTPVLQHEPRTLKEMQCMQVENGDFQNKTVALQDLVRQGSPFSAKYGSESSQLEISNSTTSTPSLKDRKHHEANKRGGMYLEDVDVLAGATLRQAIDQNCKNEFHSQENLIFHIPKDHKPGTFPKALSIESLSPTDSVLNWKRDSVSLTNKTPKEHKPLVSCSKESRVSIYDNVPSSHLCASTGDLLDLERENLFPHLDDILQHVNGLQEYIDDWSKNVLPEQKKNALSIGELESLSCQSPSKISLEFEQNSMSDGHTTPSDIDRDGASLNESEAPGVRERRDSGVGASLTRPNRFVTRSHFPLRMGNREIKILQLCRKLKFFS